MHQEKKFSAHFLDEFLVGFIQRLRHGFLDSVLFLCTIVDFFALEWRVLQSRRFVVFEFFECLVLVTGHREVDFAIGIVPVQCDANIPDTGPINAAFVVFFNY